MENNNIIEGNSIEDAIKTYQWKIIILLKETQLKMQLKRINGK